MIQSKIKQLMEDRGVSLKKMAMDTGLAEMTIIRARREQIAFCQLNTLLVIADYLGYAVNDLFTRDEEKPPG